MNRIEECLAVIFKKEYQEIWSSNAICIINYDIFTNFFEIKTSKYKGLTSELFNLIKASEKDFINNVNSKLAYYDKDNEYSIYIFRKKYIEKLRKNSNIEIEEVYRYLANRVNGKEFITNGQEIEFINRSFKKINKWSTHDINNMLNIPNGNNNKEEVDDEQLTIEDIFRNIGITAIPVSFPTEIIQKQMNEQTHSITEIKENSEETEFDINKIDVNNIIKDINRKIVGQEKTIETLVSNIYYNQLLLDTLNKKEINNPLLLDSQKISILLDGATGTGKTAILKDIATKFGLPIVISNANSFSETGYVGPTITDILEKLLNQVKGDLLLAQRGIVVLDEIDKIAIDKNVVGKDMKEGVQEELLGFISGGEYDLNLSSGMFPIKVPFDTSQLTFILSGAFTDIRDKKIKENENTGIGFNDHIIKLRDKEYQILPEDYIEYGLKKEFFGRIKVLTSTKTYLPEDLEKILLTSEISPLKNFEETVKMFGYSGITYNDDFIKKIVKEAYEMNTGARALQTILAGIQNIMLMSLINQDYNLNEPIVLNDTLIHKYEKSRIRKY